MQPPPTSLPTRPTQHTMAGLCTFLRRTKPQPLAITADIELQLFHRYWRLYGDDPTADIQYTRFIGMLLTAAEVGPRLSEELNFNLCSRGILGY